MARKFDELAELLVQLISVPDRPGFRFVIPIHFEQVLKGKHGTTRLVGRATLRYLDALIPKEKLARGDRAKRLAGQTQDALIRSMVKQVRAARMSRVATDEALDAIAKLFAISVDTIPDIMKRKSERERGKAIDKRRFRRKQKSINRPQTGGSGSG